MAINELKTSVRRFFPDPENGARSTFRGWSLPQGRSERLLFSFLVGTNHFKNLDFFADERYWKILGVAKHGAPPAAQEARFPMWVFLTLPIPFVFHYLAYYKIQEANCFRIAHWIETGEYIALDAVHIVAFAFHMGTVVLMLWLTYGVYGLLGVGMLFIDKPVPFSQQTKAEALALIPATATERQA